MLSDLTSLCIMSSFVALVAILGVATAENYAPLPTACPLSNSVSYTDVYLTVRKIDAVGTKLALPKLSLSTVYVTSALPATHRIYETVTAEAQHIYLTKVEVVPRTVSFLAPVLDTVWKTACQTVVEISTQTVSTDVTVTEFEYSYRTRTRKVLMYQTQVDDVTKTIAEVEKSTLVEVEVVDVTEVLTQTVVVRSVASVTAVAPLYNTLTKTVTQFHKATRCPKVSTDW